MAQRQNHSRERHADGRRRLEGAQVTTPKCDPCDGRAIDCAYCEHNPKNARPLPVLNVAASPLDKQVGGSHYKGFKIQPIEFAAANGLSFLEGNVVKYTVRRKGDKAKRVEDLRKAIDNLEKLIHFVEQDICN